MYRDDEDELLELDRDKLDPIQVDGIGEEDSPDADAENEEDEDFEEVLTCAECEMEFPEDEIYLAESGLAFCSGQCFEDHENKSRIPIDK